MASLLPVSFAALRSSAPPACHLVPATRALAAALLILALGHSSAPAQIPTGNLVEPSDSPAVITAEELLFDEELGVIIARGNVEISQDDRLMRADEVVYNRRTDVVAATGNVVLVEPTGEVLFLDYAELQGDLAEGFIERIGILFPDDSRLAANSGVRRNGAVTRVERAIYTPCALCEEDVSGDGRPIWRIRAAQAEHDQEAGDIVYTDAFFDFFGMPVFYLPYFRHPDPTVRQRSGFLTPSFGSNATFGQFFIAPYYIAIGPDRDATIRAGYTSDAGYFLRGEYRQRFTFGDVFIDASTNRSDVQVGDDPDVLDPQQRGHLIVNGSAQLSPNWRVSGNLFLTSDDTYLETFGITDDDVISSRLTAEGFFDLSYARAEIISYEDLRAEAIAQPDIVPSVRYNFASGPDAILGGMVTADAEFTNLEQSDERTRRWSLGSGWTRRDVIGPGFVLDTDFEARGDFYLTDDIVDPDTGAVLDDVFAARGYGSAAWQLRFPLVRTDETFQTVFEPLIGFSLADNIDNGEPIPNNDALSPEFDYNNLFAANRFSGLDRVEEGVRATYGVRAGIHSSEGYGGELFLGQDFRVVGENDFPTGSGLETDLSDIVGSLSITTPPYFNLDYRFRLDGDEFTPERQELVGAFSYDGYSISANYLQLNEVEGSSIGVDREEISVSTSARIIENVTANGSWRYDLAAGESRSFSAGLAYTDQCFVASVSFLRDFTVDRDREDGDTILFQFSLRNISEGLAPGGFNFEL